MFSSSYMYTQFWLHIFHDHKKYVAVFLVINITITFTAFLHTSPPFSELPCILEVNTFHMLVNLHFTLSSLFAAVTCPHGPNGPNGSNPVLPALIGITDHHIVRITAASHVLQYLLTCKPCPAAMEVDARKHENSNSFVRIASFMCVCSRACCSLQVSFWYWIWNRNWSSAIVDQV